jgi:ABC-type transport system substrate-binding protein
MIMKKLIIVSVLILLAFVIVACQPETEIVEVTRVVTETIVEEGESVEVTRIVSEEVEVTRIVEVEVLVEAEPEEEETAGEMEPAAGGSLRIAMGTEPLAFDPPNYLATTDLIVTKLIFDGLVKFDNELNVVPALGTEWEQIDDTTWRFNLREGVQFSDGSDFNAEDVKASFERGAQMRRGQAFIGFIESVDIIDDFTVDINLSAPFGPFLQHMATPVAVVTSSDHLAETSDEDLQLNPIGTGPYILDEFVPQQSTHLVRNDLYWGDEPYYLDEVTFFVIPEEATRFAALQAGDVDVIENPPPHEAASIEADPNLQLITSPGTRDVRLAFQVGNDPVNDPILRKAIAHAIDTETLVNLVVEGLARHADTGWLPPEVFTAAPSVGLEYDPELAMELLAEAGYPDGLTLELRTPQGRYLRDREIAEAIQGQLAEVGVDVELVTMEWGAYLDSLAAHEGQMFIIGWGVSTGDPAVVSRQNLASDSSFNFAGYFNSDLDGLLAEAEQTSDQDRRREIYQQMTELILLEDTIMKPIYWKLNLFASDSKVHNFLPTPLEQIDLSETWIEQG